MVLVARLETGPEDVLLNPFTHSHLKYSMDQVGLKLPILLPQPRERWDLSVCHGAWVDTGDTMFTNRNSYTS